MKDWAKEHLVVIGGIGVGIAIIQVSFLANSSKLSKFASMCAIKCQFNIAVLFSLYYYRL
jgi:hypothetical protein